MTLTPVTGTTGAAAAAAAAGTSKADGLGSLGKDAFLKLLVAQLKYQNPLDPQDPSQMMGQTAQFTMVEKLSDLVDEMKAQVASQRGVLAGSLVGRNVHATLEDGTEVNGTVTTVNLAGSEPTVHIGTRDVPVTRVTTVAAPSTTPTQP